MWGLLVVYVIKSVSPKGKVLIKALWDCKLCSSVIVLKVFQPVSERGQFNHVY